MRMFDSIDLNGQIFGNVVDESEDENLISIFFDVDMDSIAIVT